MKTTEFLEEVDAMLAKAKAANPEFNPPCREGCCHCCYEPAYATNHEIDDILSTMTEPEKDRLSERVRAWVDKVRGLLGQRLPNAIPYRRLNAPCPMLVDGRCSVYALRPFGCRIFFAKEKAENCAMPARKHQQFVFFSPDVFADAVGAMLVRNQGVVSDHIGVLLAERLLGLKLPDASREVVQVEMEAVP